MVPAMDLTAPPQADALDMALSRELQTGERVLWQGRPLPRVLVKGFGIYLFAIPWTAFSLFWMTMAAGGAVASWDSIGPLALAFPLFGLPFVAIGVGMLSVPFLPLFVRDRVAFAITDRRLLRFVLLKRLRTQSYAGNRIGSFDRTERPDGSGSLSIVIGSHIDGDGDRRVDKLVIGEVPDIMAVERHVRAMQDGLQRQPVSS